MISMVIIISILIIMIIIIIMMMVMRMLDMTDIMMLEAPICEKMAQILDMTIPNINFERVKTNFCCTTQ